MRKLVSALILLSISLGLPLVTQADPKSDLKAFQDFYKKRFPKVKLDSYVDGIYALPGAENQRAEWKEIMVFPPHELALASGKKFWKKNKLASCFRNGGVGIAQNYPYWDNKTKQVVTVEMDINRCLERKKLKPISFEKGKMAQVTAYMRSLSNGKRIKLDLSNPGMIAEYERGKRYYWARRGQLNFSCAHCHVQNAGLFVGGNIISAGLGHGVGFPVYRSKWGGIGTLHRRYIGCNKQVRANPLKPQSREYKAVELYETYMNTGLPLKVPSQRF